MAPLDFCPTLAEMYRTGMAKNASGVETQVTGLSTVNNLLLIRRIMLELKPGATLEVGLAAGGSALTFTASHRDLGASAARQHIAIDPYQRNFVGTTLLRRAKLDPFCEVIEEPSCLALPRLMREGRRFDLIYVDGSHAFQEAIIDFYYARHLLPIGGVVLFDDCTSRGVSELIKFIRTEIVSMREFDLSPFRDDPARYRIARLLRKAQCLAFKKIADPRKDESWQWEH